MGRGPKLRTRHEDKTNDRQSTTAENKDATDLTATTVTNATTSHYEMRNKPIEMDRKITEKVKVEPWDDFMGDDFGLPYQQVLCIHSRERTQRYG